MKHLHTLGIYFGTKTFKAACGKTCKAADLALTEDADCPACRKEAEENFEAMKTLLKYSEAQNLPSAAAARVSLPAGPRYRSALFL